MIRFARVTVLACLAMACSSEDSSNASRVIERAVEAVGGADALLAVSTMSMRGTMTITAGDFYQENHFVALVKRPDKSYYETPLGSRKLIFATNGKMAWTQNDGALAPYAMPENEAASVMRQAVFEPFYFRLEERGVSVRYLGETTVKPLDRPDLPVRMEALRYAYSDGDSIDAYFDLESGRLQSTSRRIETSIGPTQTQTFFGDYRPVGDVMIAHRRVTLFPGERHVTVVDTVEINTPIDDAVFELAPPPELSAEQIDAIVGVYDIAGKETITITRQGNALYYQNNNNSKIRMTAAADTLFLVGTGHEMHNLIFSNIVDGRAQIITLQKGEDKRAGWRKSSSTP